MHNAVGLISANYSTPNLRNLTKYRTIGALPFGGRYSLIDFQLSNMAYAGITNVGLFLPFKYRSILSHIKAGKPWSLDRKNSGLFYLPGSVFGVSDFESHILMRDIISNKAFIEMAPEPYVIITAVGTIFRFDFEDLMNEHRRSGADVTIMYKQSLRDCPESMKFHIKGQRIIGGHRGVKKGDDCCMDCVIMSTDLLLKLCNWYENMSYMDLIEILLSDINRISIFGYRFDGWQASISSVQDYYDESMDLLHYNPRRELFLSGHPILTRVQDTPPTRYHSDAKVSNSLIPSGCSVSGTIKNSILFRNVRVEKGAKVKNSIIFQDVVIKQGATVSNAIIDKNNVIGREVEIKGKDGKPFILDKKPFDPNRLYRN